MKLLCSIPGIDSNSTITIIFEIGTDIGYFSCHYRLASWTGLTRGCIQTAGKKKSVKISRSGIYLKPVLVEIAYCAVRDRENSYYTNKSNMISKRRGKNIRIFLY